SPTRHTCCYRDWSSVVCSSDLPPEPFTAPPSHSFPPPLPHRRTCLLAPGKNSAAPKRTFSSALVSADGGPKGKMIEGRSGGSWRGTRRELWAPPDSGSAHRRIAGL